MNKISFKALVILVSFWASAAVHAITIEVLPASPSVSIGGEVSVDVRISGLGDGSSPSLSTFDLDLLFDPLVLSIDTTDSDLNGVIDSVTLDPSGQLDVLGLGGNLVSADLLGAGRLDLFDASFDSPADLDALQVDGFTLATLSFTALGAGGSALSIDLADASLSLGDSLGDPLQDLTFLAGNVSVTQGAVPEPASLVLLIIGIGLILAVSRGRSVQEQ